VAVWRRKIEKSMRMGCGITLVVFGFLGSVSSFIGDKCTVGDNCTGGRISGLCLKPGCLF
jgi:hypothetical protein